MSASLQTVFRLLIAGVACLLTPVSLSAQSAPAPQPLPRFNGYLGILHPIVTLSSQSHEFNFTSYYAVGFPMGLNVWKTKKVGFSVEIVPTIRSDRQVSKVSNVLFHPGILVDLGNNFTLANRLAFETSGRYGFTPVLNKIVKRTKANGYFVALPIPVRFGNDRPTTVTAGFQFGITF
nr:hypothetical protein [uncultured Arsenicibacter sp.]